MNKRFKEAAWALVGGAAVFTAMLAGGAGRGEQPDKSPPKDKAPAKNAAPAMDDDAKAAMQEWMKLGAPGPMHEKLKKLEGRYTTVSRVWMDPQGKPMESPGEATFKMVLGGRFLQQDYQGQMMGMPMNGVGLMGYDNFRNQFVGMWIDSMSSAMFTMRGGLSMDGNVITMHGEMDEPSMKQIGKTVKWVTRMNSADSMTFEAWEVQHGDPFKAFEVEYTRKK